MQTQLATALGNINLTWEGSVLQSISLPANPFAHHDLVLPADDASDIEHWLCAYANHPQHQPPQIAWDDLLKSITLSTTPTGLRIYKAMYDIGYGQTATYNDLALQAQTGPRVVGHWCAKNPFPLLIPCHRVIAANGLGNYALGPDYKKLLLHREGAI